MSFELENKLQDWVSSQRIDKAIEYAESKLRSLPKSGFNKILGKNILHHKEELARFVDNFYSKSIKDYRKLNPNFIKRLFSKDSEAPKTLKSLSCEMASYSISDTCNFNLFALSKDEGLEQLDWLADFEFNSLDDFEISGLEELVEVYLTYYDEEQYDDQFLESSWETCEYLLTLRLQELFQETVQILRTRNIIWDSLPIYIFAHDSDLTYRTI